MPSHLDLLVLHLVCDVCVRCELALWAKWHHRGQLVAETTTRSSKNLSWEEKSWVSMHFQQMNLGLKAWNCFNSAPFQPEGFMFLDPKSFATIAASEGGWLSFDLWLGKVRHTTVNMFRNSRRCPQHPQLLLFGTRCNNRCLACISSDSGPLADQPCRSHGGWSHGWNERLSCEWDDM